VLDFGAPRLSRFRPLGRMNYAADVFALGAVLHASLTGYQGDFAPPPPTLPTPSSSHAEGTVALDGVVMRALSSNPDARQTNASVFAAELEAAVGPALFTHGQLAEVVRTLFKERIRLLTSLGAMGDLAPASHTQDDEEEEDHEPDAATSVVSPEMLASAMPLPPPPPGQSQEGVTVVGELPKPPPHVPMSSVSPVPKALGAGETNDQLKPIIEPTMAAAPKALARTRPSAPEPARLRRTTQSERDRARGQEFIVTPALGTKVVPQDLVEVERAETSIRAKGPSPEPHPVAKNPLLRASHPDHPKVPEFGPDPSDGGGLRRLMIFLLVVVIALAAGVVRKLLLRRPGVLPQVRVGAVLDPPATPPDAGPQDVLVAESDGAGADDEEGEEEEELDGGLEPSGLDAGVADGGTAHKLVKYKKRKKRRHH
jgi:hypothetical protein